MDCDKDNICKRQSCKTEREERKTMSKDKHEQRLAQQRGGEKSAWNDKKKGQENGKIKLQGEAEEIRMK